MEVSKTDIVFFKIEDKRCERMINIFFVIFRQKKKKRDVLY